MTTTCISSCKRRKVTESEELIENGCVIYFVPDRIQKARLAMLTKLAHKHNFKISETFSPQVTHIVSAYHHVGQVQKYLGIEQDLKPPSSNVHIVSVEWFTESIKSGIPLPVSEKHLLESLPKILNPAEVASSSKDCSNKLKDIPKFACQRKSPLNHKNKKFVESLLSLADYADLRNDSSQNDYGRSLAFNKAAAVLKCLDYEITSVNQVKNIKDIGEHSKTIIQDILSNGYSSEVEELCSEWYQTVKMFTGVYGVGPATGKKWYEMGMRCLVDVVRNEKISLKEERILYGIAHYTELNSKLSKSEADQILHFISHELSRIDKEIRAELMGGFKRGKPFGHDCDILISHPESGGEVGILIKLYNSLKEKDMILQGTKHSNTFNAQLLSDPSFMSIDDGGMDEFEKHIAILKFKKEYLNVKHSEITLCEEVKCVNALRTMRESGQTLSSDRQRLLRILEDCVNSERDWVARRVDLVVTPQNHYAYAVLGWTGNKNFNRSIRLYAKKIKNIKLSSHGMWSFTEQRAIPAKTEEEIFMKLCLEYIGPEERNV